MSLEQIFQQEITLRSSIKPELMRKLLFKGTLLAGIGAVSILLAGLFLSPDYLAIWGLPIFLIGMGLITIGLLPYRRLKRLELNPHKLIIRPSESVQLLIKGKTVLVIPWNEIAKIEYEDHETNYGIRFFFKSSENIPIFIPFFSRRSYQTLLDCQSH